MSKRTRALRYYRSYKPQGPFKKLFGFIFRLVLALFFLSLAVQTIFIQVYAQRDNDGEIRRYLASPLLYGPEIEIIQYRFPSMKAPQRGELVILSYNSSGRDPWYTDTLNSISRFFTFNKKEFFSGSDSRYGSQEILCRVLGMPGDTVKTESFRVKIKQSGNSLFSDEMEVLSSAYSIQVPSQSNRIQKGLPFSGNHPELVLSEGEYLLVPDNRAMLGITSNWKACESAMIKAKVLLSFWPSFRIE